MPITAETFEPKHFDALSRGLTVAKEAYETIADRLAHETTYLKAANEKIFDLEQALPITPAQWEKLVVYIEDLERGIRTPAEVVACLKAMQ
jgi:hypothetical protein